MFHRERVLIEFVRAAGRPVQRIELMKWCFLLRHETTSRGGSAFYDFLPYRFGPYSFVLDRDAGRLAADGRLTTDGDRWRAEVATRPPGRLAADTERDIGRVLRRHVGRSLSDLLDTVYDAHPRFTMNSERRKLVARPLAAPAVYTAGYEGKQVDAFLNLLVQEGIGRLVDVRNNPVSRRYGFHKSTLARLCGNMQIKYDHAPELGIRPALRQNLSDPVVRGRLFDDYEQAVRDIVLDDLCGRVAAGPTVLVCQEADPVCCHRSRLARVVAERTGLPVIHLGIESCPEPRNSLPPTC